MSYTLSEKPKHLSPARYRRTAQERVNSRNASVNAWQMGRAAPSGSDRVALRQVKRPSAPLRRQESLENMIVANTKEWELTKRCRVRKQNTSNLQNPAAHQAAAGSPGPALGHCSSAKLITTTSGPVSIELQDPSNHGKSRPNVTPQMAHQEVGTGKGIIRPQGGNESSVAQKMDIVLRRSSSDTTKRSARPPPLSKDTFEGRRMPPVGSKTYASSGRAVVAGASPLQKSGSPAVRLTSLPDKELDGPVASRLRQALTFISPMELRCAMRRKGRVAQAPQQTGVRPQRKIDEKLEMDCEQKKNTHRQEAVGVSADTYSGLGSLSGFLDHHSISSAAPSASIMLRKADRISEKSARETKRLLGGKTVFGVSAAHGPVQVGISGPVQPGVARQVTATVEAERYENDTMSATSKDGGGDAGFSRLDHGLVSAATTTVHAGARVTADGSDMISPRVLGSDKDQAQVLLTIKEGILKRSGVTSPSASWIIKPENVGPVQVQRTDESSACGPSAVLQNGMQRWSTFSNDDFLSSRSAATLTMPNTNTRSTAKVSFSSRICFHVVWSATEYDRRGEALACNRLTPMMAQQIKKELNNFKVEMDVHEQSKPHTHFFT